MPGTCTVSDLRRGIAGNSYNAQGAVEFDFTADAADASFPVGSSDVGLGGLIDDVGIIFDAVTAPNTLTISIKDGYGAVIYSAVGVTATQARGLLMQSIPIVNGLTITLTANATNSAKVKIVIYVV